LVVLGIWTGVGVLFLVGYALLPAPGGPVTTLSLVVFFAGVALLSTAVLTMLVRDLRQTDRGRRAFRIVALLLLVVASLIFFAFSYHRLARTPGEFVGLTTGLDAFYFTVTTATTVGFGDIHAAGQTARLEVTIQMVFNLVILGAAARLLMGILRSRPERPASG